MAFNGLFPLEGIGYNFASPNILDTLSVGFAPLAIQCLILSASKFILSFLSLGNNGL